MGVQCYLIEPGKKITTYVVGCSNKHRTELITLELDFDDAPYPDIESVVDAGWPGFCPHCGVTMKYDGEHEDGWRTKIGQTTWVNKETGEERQNIWDWEPGAMFDADWLPWKGPDGLSLSVLLPPGGQADVWHIDGFAGDDPERKPWDRNGEPPNVTVRPSILTPRYHGFLTDGVLGSV